MHTCIRAKTYIGLCITFSVVLSTYDVSYTLDICYILFWVHMVYHTRTYDVSYTLDVLSRYDVSYTRNGHILHPTYEIDVPSYIWYGCYSIYYSICDVSNDICSILHMIWMHPTSYIWYGCSILHMIWMLQHMWCIHITYDSICDVSI